MNASKWLVATVLLALPMAPLHAARARTPVIFITIDTLRADHLGCYGYERETSPNIDRLAKESVLFENVATTMATTLPAHTLLMTSSYTVRHGVRSNLMQFKQPVVTNRKFKMAAQMFKKAGYRTAAFVSTFVLGAETGIGIGFQTFDAPPPNERSAPETVEMVLEWLESQPDGEFFLWVHLFDPHNPYNPPPFFKRLFKTDDYLREFLNATQVDERHMELALKTNDLYDGEIRFADSQIGRLLDALREHDLYDPSLIVLTADHGEGLWQHDEVHHGLIFNEELDVPLIVKFPHGRGPAPHRNDALVSLIDVLPLITEELDLPLKRKQFDGVNPLRKERKYLMAERERSVERYGADHNFILRDRNWKYFLYSESDDALYDLTSDYHEIHNVIAENPEIARAMKEELLRQINEYRARGANLKVREDISPELQGTES